MQRTDYGKMNCSIARAIDVLGEPWTLLILRDLLLGFTQFDELRRDLGVSTSVLANRLERLVDQELVEREPYGDHPHRFAYQLTEKGRDAVPVLLTLVAWGDRWEAGRRGPPTEIVHESCGHATAAVLQCRECGEPLEVDDLSYRRGPGMRRGPGTELLPDQLDPPARPTRRR
jgi:DNA-binding HxlR family transcriptional regulator